MVHYLQLAERCNDHTNIWYRNLLLDNFILIRLYIDVIHFHLCCLSGLALIYQSGGIFWAILTHCKGCTTALINYRLVGCNLTYSEVLAVVYMYCNCSAVFVGGVGRFRLQFLC